MRNWTIRLSIFLLLLAVAQVLVSSLYPAEIPPEILRLDAYLADRADVIYFGDSTLTYPLGQVTTGEILQEMLPNRTVGEIAHPAYNLDLYLHYTKYILRSARGQPALSRSKGLRPTRPRVIIMPINMRSFSPEWELRPGYQFEEVKKTLALGPLLSRILSRSLEILGAFQSPISQAAFLNTTVYNGDTPVGTVADFERLTEQDALGELQRSTEFAYHDVLPSEDDAGAMGQALIYRYMSGLKEDHRQLRAMREIARLGDRADVAILFYITPINYQQGQRFVGDAFRTSLRGKIDRVQSVLADERDTPLLDLGFDLEAFAFVDMEHLREGGKTYVAEQLARAIGSEESATPSANEGTPPPLPPEEQTVAPTATRTPPPTHTRPVPTPIKTPARPLATPTPNPSVSPQRTPVSGTAPTRAVATVAPLGTIPVSPTPTLSGIFQGSVVRAVYLWHAAPRGNADRNPYEVDVYRVRYRTLDEKGGLAEIRADLFVPTGQITTTFPVLVHAPGTTGLSDACAPLNEEPEVSNWGSYRDHSLTFAARGYIVILPNGLGFDDPDRIHPYFVAELQAHVALDAARAVYHFAEDPPAEGILAQPAEAVFFMGYSSGGHAAFAAKDWAASYAPELHVAGIIGYGPTTNGEILLRENPIFAPYTIYAYRDFYGSEIVNVADVFLPKWVPTFESDVLSKCVDGIFSYYTRSTREMYTPRFRLALDNGELDDAFPLLAARLLANNTGLSGGSDIPVLILQGTGDTVVTPDSQRAFKDQLCRQGTPATYVEYPAVSHPEIRTTSFGDTLWWMQRVAEGALVETHCEPIEPSE
jgi:dienelactone hydrolase